MRILHVKDSQDREWPILPLMAAKSCDKLYSNSTLYWRPERFVANWYWQNYISRAMTDPIIIIRNCFPDQPQGGTNGHFEPAGCSPRCQRERKDRLCKLCWRCPENKQSNGQEVIHAIKRIREISLRPADWSGDCLGRNRWIRQLWGERVSPPAEIRYRGCQRTQYKERHEYYCRSPGTRERGGEGLQGPGRAQHESTRL